MTAHVALSAVRATIRATAPSASISSAGAAKIASPDSPTAKSSAAVSAALAAPKEIIASRKILTNKNLFNFKIKSPFLIINNIQENLNTFIIYFIK